jgi:hypothetical protein
MGSLDKLTVPIGRELAKWQQSMRRIDADGTRRQIADLERKLETAADRLLDVEPKLVPSVEASMAKLVTQGCTGRSVGVNPSTP